MNNNNCTITTIGEYYSKYKNDWFALLNVLITLRLIKATVTCPTCRRQIPLNRVRMEYRCSRLYRKNGRRSKCRTTISARKLTFFEKSKLPITKIVEFVCWWVYTGHRRYATIARETGLGSEAISNWSSFCREVCVDWALSRDQPLGGPGKIVEIDEAKFGKAKYHRGRRIEGTWVFGGIERDSKKTFFVPVENRSRETLLEIIKDRILPGTTIMSHCWKAYDCLTNEGFHQHAINHSLNFVDPQHRTVYTQNIERQWRDLRGGMPTYGRREPMFCGYIAEAHFKKVNGSNGECALHEMWAAIRSLYPGMP